MDLMQTIQSNLLQLLKDHRSNSSDPNYPAVIEAYGGQAQDVDRKVPGYPAVYVDVPSNFKLSGQDVKASMLSGDYTPELILFERNEASGSDAHSAGAALIDWCVGALRGQFITVGDNRFPIAKNITGQAHTDLDPWMAVLKLNLTSLS